MPVQPEEFLSQRPPMKTAAAARESLKLELAAEILRNFAEVQFVARGSSMLPSIYPGDCLTVRAFDDGAPRCGDVVLCRIADGFRVHRMVRILGEESARLYVLRGDALTNEDAPVSGVELLGRVTLIERRGQVLELRAAMGMWQRALGMAVRRSKIAAALLLRWHALQEQNFHRAAPVVAGAGITKTECM
jgi:hypothetical protein